MTDEDLEELGQGCRRVYDLMRDRKWHNDSEIREAAGGGEEATEGLRRMRELRASGLMIARRRIEASRRWEYRIADPKDDVDREAEADQFIENVQSEA